MERRPAQRAKAGTEAGTERVNKERSRHGTEVGKVGSMRTEESVSAKFRMAIKPHIIVKHIYLDANVGARLDRRSKF